MFSIIKHCNRIYSSNTYIIKDTETKECCLVDAGDPEEIISIIGSCSLKGIFLTHTHYDHIYGLNEVLGKFPDATIYTNDFGEKALSSPSDNLSLYHDEYFVINKSAKVVCLKSGDIVRCGSHFTANVIATPGHDKSCICYISDDNIFTGDSYIPGHKVFAKLQNGDKVEAEKSQRLIMSLCGSRIIHPGHT